MTTKINKMENITIEIIPNRNEFDGKGEKQFSFIEDNLEIKRLLQGAILGYGIDNLDNLNVDKQKAWSFVYENNSSALSEDDVRHLINSFELSSVVTHSLTFEYKFK